MAQSSRDAIWMVVLMPSGGARTRSGPAPDPMAARRERKTDAGWTTLPLEGRGRKAAPKWPLGEASSTETALWKVLWKKPQAVMWDRLGQLFQVAAYVRAYSESVAFEAPASLKTSVLRMEDMLGLSMVGMNALRWKFAEDEMVGQRAVRPAADESGPVRRLRAS